MISAGHGALTSLKVMNEQRAGCSPSSLMILHCTGSRCASLSFEGAWHAALMAALHVDTSGMSLA